MSTLVGLASAPENLQRWIGWFSRVEAEHVDRALIAIGVTAFVGSTIILSRMRQTANATPPRGQDRATPPVGGPGHGDPPRISPQLRAMLPAALREDLATIRPRLRAQLEEDLRRGVMLRDRTHRHGAIRLTATTGRMPTSSLEVDEWEHDVAAHLQVHPIWRAEFLTDPPRRRARDTALVSNPLRWRLDHRLEQLGKIVLRLTDHAIAS